MAFLFGCYCLISFIMMMYNWLLVLIKCRMCHIQNWIIPKVEVLNSRPRQPQFQWWFFIFASSWAAPLFLLFDMTAGRKYHWHNLIVVGVSPQYDIRNNTNVLHSKNWRRRWKRIFGFFCGLLWFFGFPSKDDNHSFARQTDVTDCSTPCIFRIATGICLVYISTNYIFIPRFPLCRYKDNINEALSRYGPHLVFQALLSD